MNRFDNIVFNDIFNFNILNFLSCSFNSWSSSSFHEIGEFLIVLILKEYMSWIILSRDPRTPFENQIARPLDGDHFTVSRFFASFNSFFDKKITCVQTWTRTRTNAVPAELSRGSLMRRKFSFDEKWKSILNFFESLKIFGKKYFCVLENYFLIIIKCCSGSIIRSIFISSPFVRRYYFLFLVWIWLYFFLLKYFRFQFPVHVLFRLKILVACPE